MWSLGHKQTTCSTQLCSLAFIWLKWLLFTLEFCKSMHCERQQNGTWFDYEDFSCLVLATTIWRGRHLTWCLRHSVEYLCPVSECFGFSPGSAPESGYLLMHMLTDRRWWLQYLSPFSHCRDLNWAPGSWLQLSPAPIAANIWRVNQWIEASSLCLAAPLAVCLSASPTSRYIFEST